jgi:S-adenosylmethionine-diacylglycerol 3-amino-3-carboxypropyl transferase
MLANANALLKEAVHHHPFFRFKGLQERLFTSWFGGFFYNQIWEDPRVDLEALQLDSNNRMLAIASGGCNILNYLANASSTTIHAVDLNPCHIYLTRLKLAALEYLPDYEDFFAFFGCCNCSENLQNYYRYICDKLDEATRAFWEGGNWLRRRFLGARINYFETNLYDHSRLGCFLRFVHAVARLARRDVTALLNARTPEEQRQIFDSYIAPFFDHWAVRAIGRVPFFLFGLGIPPRQLEALRKESNGQLAHFYRERVKKLACDHPVEDNYFTWQAFSRSYDTKERRALPDYLRQEKYEIAKEAVGRVHTEIDSLHAYLKRQPNHSLDRFVFLDAQDWMKAQEIMDLWREITRVGRPGSRIIFRTASSVSPIEAVLPADLRARFLREDELSRRLFEKDRSAIYGGFHIYSMIR